MTGLNVLPSDPDNLAVPLLFLDLDGTVRHGKDELGRFVDGPDDVVIFPEAVARMRAWKAGGGRVVGITNQGGIALGRVTYWQARAAIVRTHELTGGLFDRISMCQHHPDAQHPEMARCWCRKPLPGALIEAGYSLTAQHPREMYPPYMALMVGDRPEDQECARLANVDFEWAAEWRAGAAA